MSACPNSPKSSKRVACATTMATARSQGKQPRHGLPGDSGGMSVLERSMINTSSSPLAQRLRRIPAPPIVRIPVQILALSQGSTDGRFTQKRDMGLYLRSTLRTECPACSSLVRLLCVRNSCCTNCRANCPFAHQVTRPRAIRFRKQPSLSRTGQSIETSTAVPMRSSYPEVNSIPELLIFRVLPRPATGSVRRSNVVQFISHAIGKRRDLRLSTTSTSGASSLLPMTFV